MLDANSVLATGRTPSKICSDRVDIVRLKGEIYFAPTNMRVYHTALLTPADKLAYYRTLLTPDEIGRADRFIFPKDTRRFITGRAILRLLLSQHLNRPAETIQIATGTHGKPYILDTTLQFNLAHSHEMAVYAFAENHPVGIDIEHRRTIKNPHGIAKNYFSPAEQHALQTAPADQINDTFLHIWTRKEAYIKLSGDGLTRSLSSFIISADHPPRLLHDDNNPTAPTTHHYHQLPIHDDYIATVVAPAHLPLRLRAFA